MSMQHQVEIQVGGRSLSFETGLLARQADGAVVIRYGDSMVLVTATASPQPREGIDFFPLTCDYEEKMYAAGKIPGGFFKREGRPGESAVLTARLMDRPIRPLFPQGFRNDVQVIATVLSTDQENDPAILAVNGASAALMVAGLPFEGPVGAVRVGLIDGRFVINPTLRQIEEQSRLDLVVAGTADAIIMVEAGAKEVPEEQILAAFDVAHAEIRRIVEIQQRLVEMVGKPRREVTLAAAPDPALEAAVREAALPLIVQALAHPEKLAREEALRDVQQTVAAQLAERSPELFAQRAAEVGDLVYALTKAEVRRRILDEGRRPDGRGPTDIRPLTIQVGLLPRAHGSGLFQRGQTQVLTVATLGTGEDEQLLDNLGIIERKRFMHHYYFPPFSVGEVRPLRGPGRREIGHGALAERALAWAIPPEEAFPYTIRLVSEVLESNGSTSMASVCGSTLALMDAGVPIKAAVAGIAMGLVTDASGRAAILTDILGMEDQMGDMDFKVAGTRDGVTALQMDIKIKGLSRELLARALAQARQARLFILDRMLEVIPAPRTTLSPYAPRILTIEINPEKIREVIGPGGKVINRITAETGAKIDIEQDGKVHIASVDEQAARRAMQMIEEIVREVRVGEMYLGRVTRLMNFGAFVEVLPGKEGLVHISELADGRVGRVEDVVKVGDELLVKVKEIDNLGRINLTRRGVGKTAEGEPAGELQPAAPRGRAGGPRRRRRGDRSSAGGRPQGSGATGRPGARPGGGRGPAPGRSDQSGGGPPGG
ncbi:MAG: polyribonucleotide nucleotidyltransferase [Armatimonadota bacterium]|nr:polyribonucleotide nucleotidyltransferase [Armatimonadota bacterium]MDR7426851.1 polyribonucleotide nucleotidyltransferase [Armatimonadota bacterium]MDR7468798.1 polyribonucleotide nucleotidyltransferase [Armatimonadota bacterium]MDR7473681.1 polyribonucleotide nucleotidyltransferase [Armatimonadota bacterium]MDR7538625.1 polyribonucleotide nucleotidyltransferase [Armatimonadota bacterium]